MLRTFQFRLRPNATQVAALTRILSDNVETYNAALQERRDAWKLARKSISYRDQQNELTELRSKNRLRSREALRRAHQRASDARKNFCHHVSKWLVRNYDAGSNLQNLALASIRESK